MTREIYWAQAALNDFTNQISRIAKENAVAARSVASAIDIAARKLGEIATGRPGRVSGTYEKSVPRLPFVIAYTITDSPTENRIIILRIIHTSQNWPVEEWPE